MPLDCSLKRLKILDLLNVPIKTLCLVRWTNAYKNSKIWSRHSDFNDLLVTKQLMKAIHLKDRKLFLNLNECVKDYAYIRFYWLDLDLL